MLKTITILIMLCSASNVIAAINYKLLDPTDYQQVVSQSRSQLKNILEGQTPATDKNNLNTQVAFLTQLFKNTPYVNFGIGEGDWQPQSLTYQAGAKHLNQNPVYRVDQFDCQTFAQVIMALLYAHDLATFDQIYLKVAYGAAQKHDKEIVHYYNRNHFVESDFNRVNQQNGFLKDVTAQGALKPYAATIHATLTRQRWFQVQGKYPFKAIQVFAKKDVKTMYQRLTQQYPFLPYTHFATENVSMTYLPKKMLFTWDQYGKLHINQTILKKIPTPAVVEFINHPQKWRVNGKTIKEIIGSELIVSHMGFLYRKQFNQGDLIFQKINCHATPRKCQVEAVYCKEKHCDELMFTHACNSYPRHYYFYADEAGQYHCDAQKPNTNAPVTFCNRIEHLPLAHYLLDGKTNRSNFLNNAALLGLHLELLQKVNVS